MLCVIHLDDSTVSFADFVLVFVTMRLISESLCLVEVSLGKRSDCTLHPWCCVLEIVILRGEYRHSEL